MSFPSLKQTAVIVSFIALIAVNFLGTPYSGTQDKTVEQVFDENLDVLINPTPLAIVGIWFFAIFPGLGAFSVYQARRSQRDNPLLTSLRSIVIVNFILGSVWVLATQAQNFTLVNLVGAGLFFTALAMVMITGRQRTPSRVERWCVAVPFSIYLAWLSVANIVAVAGALEDSGWNGFGLSPVTWTVIMMGVAAVLGIVVLVRRHDIAFTLVIAYALTAIMLAQLQFRPIVVAWLVCVLVLAASIALISLQGRENKHLLPAA
jgi:hypothetical protein